MDFGGLAAHFGKHAVDKNSTKCMGNIRGGQEQMLIQAGDRTMDHVNMKYLTHYNTILKMKNK